MADKFTYTINLPENEADVLTELAQQKDMSKTAVMRQALRLYQLVQKADFVDIRIGSERVYVTTELGKSIL